MIIKPRFLRYLLLEYEFPGTFGPLTLSPPGAKILNFCWRQSLKTLPKNSGKIVEIGKLKNTENYCKDKAKLS